MNRGHVFKLSFWRRGKILLKIILVSLVFTLGPFVFDCPDMNKSPSRLEKLTRIGLAWCLNSNWLKFKFLLLFSFLFHLVTSNWQPGCIWLFIFHRDTLRNRLFSHTIVRYICWTSLARSDPGSYIRFRICSERNQCILMWTQKTKKEKKCDFLNIYRVTEK